MRRVLIGVDQRRLWTTPCSARRTPAGRPRGWGPGRRRGLRFHCESGGRGDRWGDGHVLTSCRIQVRQLLRGPHRGVTAAVVEQHVDPLSPLGERTKPRQPPSEFTIGVRVAAAVFFAPSSRARTSRRSINAITDGTDHLQDEKTTRPGAARAHRREHVDHGRTAALRAAVRLATTLSVCVVPVVPGLRRTVVPAAASSHLPGRQLASQSACSARSTPPSPSTT